MPFVPPAVRARRAAASVALLLVVAGCGSSAPTPVPVPPSAAPSVGTSPSAAPSASVAPSAGSSGDFAEIEEAVRQLRGLDAQESIEPEVLDEAALLEYVREEFDAENPPEYVAAWERLLKHLALVPGDANIKELYLELLGSQVLGLYDYTDDEMYVVKRPGASGALDRLTYAHEYVHVLQDQSFDLEAMQDIALDQGDRALARTALAEGDASLVMALWMRDALTQEELLDVATNALSEEQAAVMARMPAILREVLEFPYTAGLNWVAGLQTSGGWDAVNREFENPPDSTEQILHPDRRSEAPVAVSFPSDLAAGMGSGWSEVLQDTLGELQIGIWLREAGLDTVASGSVAEGWGGDRVVLLEGPDDAWATVVDIAWDSAADAEEFREAAPELIATIEEAGGQADVLTREPTSTTVVIGSDADVMGRVANVLGLAG